MREIARHWIKDEISVEEEEQEMVQLMEQEAGPSTKHHPKHDPPMRLSLDMRKHRISDREINNFAGNVVHKKVSQTFFMCRFCNVPLHRGECFENYHIKKKY